MSSSTGIPLIQVLSNDTDTIDNWYERWCDGEDDMDWRDVERNLLRFLHTQHRANQVLQDRILRRIRSGNCPDRAYEMREILIGERGPSFCVDAPETLKTEDAISYDTFTGVISVHIVDMTRFLDHTISADSRRMMTEAFLRSSPAYIPGNVQPMFPWGIVCALPSFQGTLWDHTAVTMDFYIDDDGVPQPVNGGVFLSKIDRPIRTTYDNVARMLHTVEHGEPEPQCESECGTCDACVIYMFSQLRIELTRFRNRRLEDSRGRRPEWDDHEGYGPSFSRMEVRGRTVVVVEPVVRRGRGQCCRGFARELVEDCMLAANNIVARFTDQQNIPVAYSGRENRRSGYHDHRVFHPGTGLYGYLTFTSPGRRMRDLITHLITKESILQGFPQAGQLDTQMLQEMVGSQDVVRIMTELHRRERSIQRICSGIGKSMFLNHLYGVRLRMFQVRLIREANNMVTHNSKAHHVFSVFMLMYDNLLTDVLIPENEERPVATWLSTPEREVVVRGKFLEIEPSTHFLVMKVIPPPRGSNLTLLP